MALTTVLQSIDGMTYPKEFIKVGTASVAAGILYTPFYAVGSPAAAAIPSPGINGAALTTYAGQLPFTNPASGNTYLARFSGCSTVAGSLFLVDRLWHNSGITVTTTTAQTITFPTLPARDAAGSANGVNVFAGLEITATTGNGAISNTTIEYTNSAGTTTKTGTISSVTAAAATGNFFPFELAAGDVGVRSIQSVTLGTSYVSGSVALVVYRILARVDLPLANTPNAVDSITGGHVRLYNNTVPYLMFLPTSTIAPTFTGQMIVSQG